MAAGGTDESAEGDGQAVEMPPRPENADGEMRSVGMEFEFGGLDAASAAETVADALGVVEEQLDAHRYAVASKTLGSFTVELDTRWAHPDKMRKLAGGTEIAEENDLPTRLAAFFGDVAGTVMPVEVICPPIPIARLPELRPVIRALSRAGATGTEHSAFAGFGLHLNVEVAETGVEWIHRVLRAYVLSQGWLRREAGLATIRQLQSYIDPFTVEYARLILARDYRPDMETLIADHIRHNPSRNKELDMLPLFAHIDGAAVRRLLPDEKNSPRPTFHWRLPDCRIDEPDWDWLGEWHRWVAVERLAEDEARLATLAEDFLASGPRSEFEARMARILDVIS